MRLRGLVAALLCCACTLAGAADGSLRIATASNFKSVMEQWIALFRSQHPGARVEASYAASGKLAAQILQGAPFDLFFAADREYPLQVVDAGRAATPVRWYARGHLVLWSATLDASTLTLKDLADPRYSRIAIANPRTAPYGARAVEALRASGVWAQVEPRLVYGENIAQTAQFAQTGNAQLAIIALSQALHPELASRGGYARIPAELHGKLVQGHIVTEHGRDNELAWEFADFVATDAAHRILEAGGYSVPDLWEAP